MMAEILREMTEGNPTNYEVAVPSADAPRSKLDVIWVRGENVTAAAPGPDNGDFGYAARWRSSLLATVKERSAGRMEQVERLGLAERAFASQRTTETIIQRYQPTCWDSFAPSSSCSAADQYLSKCILKVLLLSRAPMKSCTSTASPQQQ